MLFNLRFLNARGMLISDKCVDGKDFAEAYAVAHAWCAKQDFRFVGIDAKVVADASILTEAASNPKVAEAVKKPARVGA